MLVLEVFVRVSEFAGADVVAVIFHRYGELGARRQRAPAGQMLEARDVRRLLVAGVEGMRFGEILNRGADHWAVRSAAILEVGIETHDILVPVRRRAEWRIGIELNMETEIVADHVFG